MKIKQLGYCSYYSAYIYVVHHGNKLYEYCYYRGKHKHSILTYQM